MLRSVAILVGSTFLTWLLATNVTFAADAPATQPLTDEQKMESWWNDLQKPDPQGSRAVLNFSAKPEQTVAFFKQRIKPLTISEEDLNKALADLSSDDEAVWKPAFEKLSYLDPRLTTDLGTLMANVTEPVARNRLVAILCDRDADAFQGKSVQLRGVGNGEYNFFDGNGSWWAEAKVERLGAGGWETQKRTWTRVIRAIVLLEHIGTPDAIAILRDMATGHPDADPTKIAQDVLTILESGGK